MTYRNVTALAENFGISRPTMYEYINLPDAPQPIKFGSRKVYPVEEFEKFIKGLSR